MTAYYNEIDPYAAQWLRNLMAAGHIAPGDVDERSIKDVKPADLAGYTQCHFFAGIGVWSYALRLAGWPDDEPVWTGSCPCQPFSAAGKGGGFDDSRHLWPDWFRLVAAAKPRLVFGEQVASKPGLAWIDLVHADLEGAGYAVRAADICAAGVGAPHIRQRLYFVAEPESATRRQDIGTISCGETTRLRNAQGKDERRPVFDAGRLADSSTTRQLADADGGDASAEGLQRSGEHGQQPQDGGPGGLEHPEGDGRIERRTESSGRSVAVRCGEGVAAPGEVGATNGFWRGADWLPCIDGKARPVEPGTFPLAHGATARVGRLRAYGNAIVAPVAQAFIEAYLTSRPG